eukprot:Skav214068  [mRNA]  locus=scaffold2017:921087:921407:- [translate_table: standard]
MILFVQKTYETPSHYKTEPAEQVPKSQLSNLLKPWYSQHLPRGNRVSKPFASQEEQRPPLGGANYPDSSVDLTCATVDSQKVSWTDGGQQSCQSRDPERCLKAGYR